MLATANFPLTSRPFSFFAVCNDDIITALAEIYRLQGLPLLWLVRKNRHTASRASFFSGSYFKWRWDPTKNCTIACLHAVGGEKPEP